MQIANIWQHPKTSAIGILIGIVTIVPILEKVDWQHLSAASAIGLVGAIATALLGMLASDGSKQ
jgi:hypothetical protein